MKVGIVGIGLIGGSIAKRLSNSNIELFIYDNDVKVLNQAIMDNNASLITNYSELDVLILALHPNAILTFLDTNHKLLHDVIVTDICGVKECISSACDKYNIQYFGMHPMAGREVGGYANSIASLFDGANLVVTSADIPQDIDTLIQILGFGSVVVSSAVEHDAVIAYTSQLCHIASNAFAKSKTINNVDGFTGGSFEDLTRVGRLDPQLWLQLFNKNRGNLISEIETFVRHLNEYKYALEGENDARLISLLKDGVNCLNNCVKL